MIKKSRIQIPRDCAAEILFISDRTCCVCTIRGKQVQIHHIDENPSNNSLDNLAVLCFECHNETMIKGGFGRKLDSTQIKKYKENWLERVKERKQRADEIASIRTVTNELIEDYITSDEDFLNYKTSENPELLISYLNKIQVIHKAQLVIAQKKSETGVTSDMIQANSDIIDFYEEVLIELSTFYPKNHFNNKPPKKYFSELISSKFQWHRLILEPSGVGTGGTIISVMAGGNVLYDLKEMVVQMVDAILFIPEMQGEINAESWRKEWLGE